VVPSPHPLRLAVPKAFLVLRAGYKPSADLARELFGFIQRRLAPYKRVRRLEFSELPKTISGKIRRAELRKTELDRSHAERRPQEFFEEDF
jgi:acetyl-CoA synthetase